MLAKGLQKAEQVLVVFIVFMAQGLPKAGESTAPITMDTLSFWNTFGADRQTDRHCDLQSSLEYILIFPFSLTDLFSEYGAAMEILDFLP